MKAQTTYSARILNREVKVIHTFQNTGDDFTAMYAANKWCHDNGYSYGSTCVNRRIPGSAVPVALVKGEYNLPQKWINFSEEEKQSVDGIMKSYDFRNGVVTVYIF